MPCCNTSDGKQHLVKTCTSNRHWIYSRYYKYYMNDTLQWTHEKHIIVLPILWMKKLRLGKFDSKLIDCKWQSQDVVRSPRHSAASLSGLWASGCPSSPGYLHRPFKKIMYSTKPPTPGQGDLTPSCPECSWWTASLGIALCWRQLPCSWLCPF